MPAINRGDRERLGFSTFHSQSILYWMSSDCLQVAGDGICSLNLVGSMQESVTEASVHFHKALTFSLCP